MPPDERPPLLKRVVRWSTIALAALPLLGMRPMVVMIALWLVLLVAQAFVERPRPSHSAWRWCLLLAAPFLLMVVDLLRADDRLAAWHIAERSTALLLFPLGFLVLGAPADERARTTATDVFTGAALVLSLFVNLGLLLDPQLIGHAPDALFSDRYRDAFAARSGIHPPYAAYYFVCAALFQTIAALREGRFRMLRASAALLLVISAALIGSRMPLIAFAIALVPALMLSLPRRIALRGLAVSLLGLVSSAALVPSARQRIHQALDSGWHTPTSATVNSVNIRGPITQCSLELLEAHWIVGMGQPRVQPALDVCYQRFGIPMLLDGSYSTHCQPLHWWIAFGLLGLAAFLVLFGAPAAEALRNADGAALGFLVVIALCCLTENVLARQWGVVLFAFFNALFLAGRVRRKG